MKLRGVVSAFVIVISFGAMATESPPIRLSTDDNTSQMLKTLFEGVDHPPVSYFKRFNVIDIESLLEDFPEVAAQFSGLSEKEREELLAVIDEFNKAFAETLFSTALDERV